MKNILMIFSIIFLYSTSCIAQKTISKTDFEHLVDYVNCMNVLAFLEESDFNPTLFDSYKKNIAPKLQTVSLGKLEDVLNFADLQELLKDNLPAQKLADKINEKKNKYNDCQDDISLINTLSTSSWEKIDLKRTATTIKKSILAKYKLADKESENSNTDSEAVDVKKQTTQNSITGEEYQAKSDHRQRQNNDMKNGTGFFEDLKPFINFRLAEIIVLVLVVGFLAFTFFYFNNKVSKHLNREYIIQTILDSERINRKFKSQGNLINTDIFNVDEKFINTVVDRVLKCIRLDEKEKDINAIGDRALQYNRLTEEEKHQQLQTKTEPVSSLSKAIEKYFKTKNGKILQEELPNSVGSSFKIFNINNNEAKFEYCGGIVNADFFDGVCFFQNNPADVPNKTQIITTTPGLVKKDTNENWIVETLATIKFV